MNKRLLLLALALVCLVPASLAAPEGISVYDTPQLPLPHELVDSPYEPGAEFGPVILRITAPNGQPLHVVSDISTPVVHSLDVNFDGADDLAVMVSSGASNAVFRLFIKQGDRYQAVDDGQEEGLFNPVVYPGLQLVMSQGTSGLAGALHESTLFRWDGNRLAPVRGAAVENAVTTQEQEGAFTTTHWYNQLYARVYAYGPVGTEPELLFDETYDMEVQGMGEAYDAFYQREQQALWQGMQ